TDILRLTPSIPENCQWALFLRNHDELTLEMVTDEERDYMYRTYAHDRAMRINLGIRRRLAPLLENDRRKIELMNALLFSLPGTPVVYYGDEIGMGDNVYLGDRNGVRTPMQWSADRNAGFSRANPQRLYLPVNIDPEYHYEAVNVETQQNNSHSLLWWMKRMIAQRQQFRAMGRGSLEFLYPANRKVIAFVRQLEDEKILVVANLSRFTQCAELDLSKHQGFQPVEVFGRNYFPAIGDQPYFLSLGPHAFYWFNLQPRGATQDAYAASPGAENIPLIPVEASAVFGPSGRGAITRILPRLLRARPWFQGKNRTVRNTAIRDILAVPGTSAYVVLIAVEYSDGDPDTYMIPLSVATGEAAETMLHDRPQVVLARLQGADEAPAVLYAALYDRSFSDALLSAVVRRRRFKGRPGDLVAGHTAGFRKAWGMVRSDLEPHPDPREHHNTSINFGEDFVLKVYRKIEPGINPDREMEEFLTEQTSFSQVPRALGWLEYRRSFDDSEERTTLGLLTSYVRNATNGWQYTLDHLGIFFERALAIGIDDPRLRDLPSGDPLSLANQSVPPVIAELLGGHIENVRQLGCRTAELHMALSSRPDIPEFAPEPFTDFYRHGLYHGMLGHLSRCFENLRSRLPSLPAASVEEVRMILGREADVRSRLQTLRDDRVLATRIRHHGAYNLGQILFTGSDVVITNFEGNPNRPMSERRIKRSPLRDVAGMIRSFHYVSHAVLFGQVPGIVAGKDAGSQLQKWVQAWYQWVSAIFLHDYLGTAAGAAFVPPTPHGLRTLLEAY
ncbi:MAG TPA: alpha-glucosidase C-terminal domain-containing protein, partial [Terriglobales bacterium]|nr:alpha-glucosidase C-terminal domain-containing protein [Terriglobales bacterium]